MEEQPEKKNTLLLNIKNILEMNEILKKIPSSTYTKFLLDLTFKNEENYLNFLNILEKLALNVEILSKNGKIVEEKKEIKKFNESEEIQFDLDYEFENVFHKFYIQNVYIKNFNKNNTKGKIIIK